MTVSLPHTDCVVSFSEFAVNPAFPSAEHVFEGQLIADFFDRWLQNGQILNQSPAPSSPTTIASCVWTAQYITTTYGGLWTSWSGENIPFIKLLLQELGNFANLDRLTIMLKRPNQMKGRVRNPVPSPSVVQQLLWVRIANGFVDFVSHIDVHGYSVNRPTCI